MTNALVTTNADAFRASTDAATLCKAIVVASAQNIQGRKYIKVEGWQAIAVAHGCAAGSRDVERVDGGVRAIGEVRRMADGTLLATAEGFVGEDEPTWFGGVLNGKTLPKRADYAIRAMAQTRAISRACRSAFAHVVVMMNANLETTPAEEVPFDGVNDTVRDVTPPKVNAEGVRRLNSAEAKRIRLAEEIKTQIFGCTTLGELAEWDKDFDKHTAQVPTGWLDAIRNDVILRGEEIGAEQGNADMDAEYSRIVGPADHEGRAAEKSPSPA